jgi:hypothetical protein
MQPVVLARPVERLQQSSPVRVKSPAITSAALPKAQTVMSATVNMVVPLPLRRRKTAAFMGLVVREPGRFTFSRTRALEVIFLHHRLESGELEPLFSP